MEQLPAEVLDKIFGLLGRHDRLSLRVINHAGRERIEHAVQRAVVDSRARYAQLASFAARFPALEYVQMRNDLFGYQPRNSDLHAAAACPGLRELSVWGAAAIVDLSPLTRLAQLRQLELLGACNIDDGQLAVLPKLPCLEAVSLSGCRFLTDAGLRHLGRCTALRQLCLGRIYTHVSDVGLRDIMSAVPLRRLELTGVGFTAAALAPATALQGLWIAECRAFERNDASLEAIAALPALEKVELVGLGVSQQGMEALRGSPALQQINVHCCLTCMRPLVFPVAV